MHPVYTLAFVTLLLVVAFLVWNLLSVKQHQKTGGRGHETTGVGGPNDPMA